MESKETTDNDTEKDNKREQEIKWEYKITQNNQEEYGVSYVYHIGKRATTSSASVVGWFPSLNDMYMAVTQILGTIEKHMPRSSTHI